MQQILEAIQNGASGDELAALPLPESYRAVVRPQGRAGHVRGPRVGRQGPPPARSTCSEIAAARAGPRRGRTSPSWPARSTSTRCGRSIFEPLLDLRVPRPASARRATGASATTRTSTSSAPTPPGVVLRVGSAVRNWKPGDRVTVHCNHVDDQDPISHNDSMLGDNQRIWGFETNFGGLADLTVVKANQLMPKPAHLTWEEAAVNALCNSTSYRMLVSPNAAQMKQGDAVLVWGATGGIGGYAVQYVLNGGGTPVGVVSSPEQGRPAPRPGRRARHRPQGAEGYRFWSDEQHPGRVGVAPLRQGHPRPQSATTSTSCSSTPAARPSAPRCSSPPAAARSSPAPPPAAS